MSLKVPCGWLAKCVPVPGVRGSTVTHLESEVSNLGKLCQLTDQTQSYFPTRHAAQHHRWLRSQIQLLCSSANASEINVLGGEGVEEGQLYSDPAN